MRNKRLFFLSLVIALLLLLTAGTSAVSAQGRDYNGTHPYSPPPYGDDHYMPTPPHGNMRYGDHYYGDQSCGNPHNKYKPCVDYGDTYSKHYGDKHYGDKHYGDKQCRDYDCGDYEHGDDHYGDKHYGYYPHGDQSCANPHNKNKPCVGYGDPYPK